MRPLPGGAAEEFTVIDYHLRQRTERMPAYYDVKFSRPWHSADTTMNVTYNLNGVNTRVNIQSTDNSINIQTSAESVFDDLKEFIKHHIPENAKVLSAVDDLETAKGKGNFREKYIAFVSIAADHLGLLSPFLPVLSSCCEKTRCRLSSFGSISE